MQKVLSLVLVAAMLTHFGPAALGADNVASQITTMPLGSNIELRLKNKQKLRGARGAVSNAGFTLLDEHAGEKQISFDDVLSVKQVTTKSHTTRNILIGVGIGLAGAVIALVILAKKCGPFGC